MTTRSPCLFLTVVTLWNFTVPAFLASRVVCSVRVAGGAADVERAHGELGARLADRLGGDDAHRHAHLDQLAGGQVAAVAEGADAALASQVSTERMRTFSMPAACTSLAVSSVISSLALTMTSPPNGSLMSSRLTRPTMRSRSGSMTSPDSMMGLISMPSTVPQSCSEMITSWRDVDQAAGQVAGVGGLERGVGQALAGAVGRDEVLQHRQPFTEVRGDGVLDDLARRARHQAAHAGELADLLLRAAGAGVGHDVDRVELDRRPCPASPSP